MILSKNDRVIIKNNSIFDYMGLDVVTGKVTIVYPDGHGFSFKCDQTGCLETCEFNDGQIEVKESML